MTIPLIQGTLKYAFKADPGNPGDVATPARTGLLTATDGCVKSERASITLWASSPWPCSRSSTVLRSRRPARHLDGRPRPRDLIAFSRRLRPSGGQTGMDIGR